jgi:hypothetical protein
VHLRLTLTVTVVKAFTTDGLLRRDGVGLCYFFLCTERGKTTERGWVVGGRQPLVRKRRPGARKPYKEMADDGGNRVETYSSRGEGFRKCSSFRTAGLVKSFAEGSPAHDVGRDHDGCGGVAMGDGGQPPPIVRPGGIFVRRVWSPRVRRRR